MNEPTEAKPTSFNIRVLSDGTYILSSGPDDEYAYDSVDELLDGLRSDLESSSPDDGEDPTVDRKKEVKKMMTEEPDEE